MDDADTTGEIHQFSAVTLPNMVAPGVTAVAYNLTVTQTAGSRFLAIAAGSAAAYSVSVINWTAADATIANAGLVAVDASRRVKVLNGASGGTHFVIDIGGYYL
jgi:hypothetical protein